jgi:hypothetical protein
VIENFEEKRAGRGSGGILFLGKFQIYPSNLRNFQIYPTIFHIYRFTLPSGGFMEIT